MNSHSVIKDFDVVEQLVTRCLSRGEVFVMHQLIFQSAEETFAARVIPTIALAAHALRATPGMSDVQTSSGRRALKLRASTFSATAREWCESVVRTNFLTRFTLMPCSRLSLATRLWLTRAPAIG
jgi:hypothetical protein